MMKTRVADIAKVAFETSMKRKKVLHNIHKSNVLKSSVLWNEVLEEVGQNYPEVEVRHILVDAGSNLSVPKSRSVRRDGHGKHVRRHIE